MQDTHDSLKLFQQIMVTFSVLFVATAVGYYFFDYIPSAHAESLRIKAEQDCQTRLDKKLVNIADSDQLNWKNLCIKDKLATWK